ncbi:MAG: hypothetical protein KAW56_07075 [Candidatus Marinimicrobia bacterium]|nr:hypothetical protein [Candidatus Neomarinimicrobiota bacterium]
MDKQELKDIRAMLHRYKIFRHQELLNNCVDDDEAILHKREIKEVR